MNHYLVNFHYSKYFILWISNNLSVLLLVDTCILYSVELSRIMLLWYFCTHFCCACICISGEYPGAGLLRHTVCVLNVSRWLTARVMTWGLGRFVPFQQWGEVQMLHSHTISGVAKCVCVCVCVGVCMCVYIYACMYMCVCVYYTLCNSTYSKYSGIIYNTYSIYTYTLYITLYVCVYICVFILDVIISWLCF